MLQFNIQIFSNVSMANFKKLSFVLVKNIAELFVMPSKGITFVSTVLATLPIRTASQGGSFALKFSTQDNTPPMPLSDAHLGGLFIL